MSSVNTLELKRYQNSSAVDVEETYGVVVLECDNEQKEASNITTQEWYGVNGDEVYIPAQGVKYKAYDVNMTLGVKAGNNKTARERMDTFVAYLSGVVWWSVKQPYKGSTWKGVSLSKYELDDKGEDWVSFKVVLHVSNP